MIQAETYRLSRDKCGVTYDGRDIGHIERYENTGNWRAFDQLGQQIRGGIVYPTKIDAIAAVVSCR